MKEIAHTVPAAPSRTESTRASCKGCCDECDPHGFSKPTNQELVCQACEKAFKRVQFRVWHDRQVHKKWRFYCGRCGVGCHKRIRLKEHYEKFHREYLNEVASINCGPPPADSSEDNDEEAYETSKSIDKGFNNQEPHSKVPEGCVDGGPVLGYSELDKNGDALDETPVSPAESNKSDSRDQYMDISVDGKPVPNYNGSDIEETTVYVPDAPPKPNLYQHASIFESLSHPTMLNEQKSVYFAHFNIPVPLLEASWFERDSVSASGIRSLATLVALSMDDVDAARQYWEEGISILDELLCEDENNDKIDWVQSSIPLFLITGQFAFPLSESQYQLLNLAMANCQKHLIRDNQESEASIRALWGFYTVEQLKRIFNHGISAVGFTSLTIRLPSLDQSQQHPHSKPFIVSEVIEQLHAGPVVFSECRLTGLVLLCALFELERRMPDKEKTLLLLQNLRASVLNSQGHIPRGTTLFWGLYHLLKTESVFYFHRPPAKGLLASDPINALIQEQEIWNQVHLHLSLPQCASKLGDISESLSWALANLVYRPGKPDELPLDRLYIQRIVYIGCLLIESLEDEDKTPNPTFKSFSSHWYNITYRIANKLPQTGTPSEKLRKFCTKQLHSPGAWKIGPKLPHI
jgi:hypothetical protein